MHIDIPLEAAQAKNEPRKASELLEELIAGLPSETVSAGQLLERLEGRAFGLMLLLLSLPMCIPNIPGVSTIFGVLMLIPGVQMVRARHGIWLPRRVREWTFSREALRKGVGAALPILRRLERMARPRWCLLVRHPFFVFWWGVLVLVMAIVLILPIPGGNITVAIPVALLSLALLQQDGALALVSGAMSAGTLALVYCIIRFGPKLLVTFGKALDALVSWLPG